MRQSRIVYQARLKSSPASIVRSGLCDPAVAKAGEWIRLKGAWYKVEGVFWTLEEEAHGDTAEEMSQSMMSEITTVNLVVTRDDDGPAFLS